MSKKRKLSSEAYKGVRDFYPEDQALLRYFSTIQRGVVERFGYEEYHASILEPTELYREKTSEEIFNEQMYTFTDRGGREVTLRPEMTPTVARMIAKRRRELGFPLRLYSIPNVFRYERPQRGRLREHWQLNVDFFGSESLNADAEIIHVAHAIMSAFGATESDFTIQVSSRTFLNERAQKLNLSEDRLRALRTHLDQRDKMTLQQFNEGIEAFGILPDSLFPDFPPKDVAEVLQLLEEQGIKNAIFAPHIVRGFDYYSGVVFEIFDTNPDNNRALFGGGRFDNLLELFDDEHIPAVGFGMGDVTLRDFLETRGLLPPYLPTTQVYIAVPSLACIPQAQELCNFLRSQGVNVAIDFGEKKLADQIRTASKHAIPYLIVVGETEISSGSFVIRDLRSGEEHTYTRQQLPAFFLMA